MSSLTSAKPVYTIFEYGGFVCGDSSSDDYKVLPKQTFEALERFILANRTETDTAAYDLLALSIRHGVKMITAKNYVGVITMTDGTVIEILPKIHNAGVSAERTKRIFLEMLKTLKTAPFKNLSVANLKTARMSLFEIFITMFADEVSTLAKQGLKSAYSPVEQNELFFKGKLMVSRNLKHNLINRERFYVRYSEFNANRPENRLITSALSFLLGQSRDYGNRLNLRRLQTIFENIALSTNYDADFDKCSVDRSMAHYEKALAWCRVFLKGNSFTAFAGSKVSLALLFPMEKIFESYIAEKMRWLAPNDVELRIQDNKYSLFDRPNKAFSMRPDIVKINSGVTVVMDTKWKLLSDAMRNYGISQSDMYQMYAYGKKYDAEKIVLLYPLPEGLRRADIAFYADDGVSVEVAFIDLLQPDASIRAVI